MELETVAKALGRMTSVFERRPSSAIHADSSATVSWNGGLQTSVAHPNGAVFVTDMPSEFEVAANMSPQAGSCAPALRAVPQLAS
jgi:hypothetical protein